MQKEETSTPLQIVVQVEPFIKAYLLNRYEHQSPIKPGKTDPISALIYSNLRATPPFTAKFMKANETGCVVFEVPKFAAIDTRKFNYIFPSQMPIINDYIRETIFYTDFYNFMTDTYSEHGELKAFLETFMEQRGLNCDLISEETLKKRWYRFRSARK